MWAERILTGIAALGVVILCLWLCWAFGELCAKAEQAVKRTKHERQLHRINRQIARRPRLARRRT